MKLRNLAVAGIMFAGSLHASILYNQSSGLGIGPGPNSIFQDFSNPTSATTLQQQIGTGPSATTGVLFSNLTVVANTNLYYDPNGAASGGCGRGKNTGGNPTLPSLTACVGNYFLANTTTDNQSTVQPSLTGVLAQMDLIFNNPVFATSFLFAAPATQGGSIVDFQIDILNASHQIIDTMTLKSTTSSPAYFDIAENMGFTEIDITQLSYIAGTQGLAPATSFNALIGDVKAVTAAPEPGTIGLIGFGLAGLGYFARRRRNA